MDPEISDIKNPYADSEEIDTPMKDVQYEIDINEEEPSDIIQKDVKRQRRRRNRDENENEDSKKPKRNSRHQKYPRENKNKKQPQFEELIKRKIKEVEMDEEGQKDLEKRQALSEGDQIEIERHAIEEINEKIINYQKERQFQKKREKKQKTFDKRDSKERMQEFRHALKQGNLDQIKKHLENAVNKGRERKIEQMHSEGDSIESDVEVEKKQTSRERKRRQKAEKRLQKQRQKEQKKQLKKSQLEEKRKQREEEKQSKVKGERHRRHEKGDEKGEKSEYRRVKLQQVNGEMKEIPEELLCPITQQLMKNPLMITVCGHTFQGQVIQEWLQKNGKCPICKKKARSGDLQKNFAIVGLSSHYQ